jgi:hypothetical protein
MTDEMVDEELHNTIHPMVAIIDEAAYTYCRELIAQQTPIDQVRVAVRAMNTIVNTIVNTAAKELQTVRGTHKYLIPVCNSYAIIASLFLYENVPGYRDMAVELLDVEMPTFKSMTKHRKTSTVLEMLLKQTYADAFIEQYLRGSTAACSAAAAAGQTVADYFYDCAIADGKEN